MTDKQVRQQIDRQESRPDRGKRKVSGKTPDDDDVRRVEQQLRKLENISGTAKAIIFFRIGPSSISIV
jgi:hypothetical protein